MAKSCSGLAPALPEPGGDMSSARLPSSSVVRPERPPTAVARARPHRPAAARVPQRVHRRHPRVRAAHAAAARPATFATAAATIAADAAQGAARDAATYGLQRRLHPGDRGVDPRDDPIDARRKRRHGRRFRFWRGGCRATRVP